MQNSFIDYIVFVYSIKDLFTFSNIHIICTYAIIFRIYISLIFVLYVKYFPIFIIKINH
ncbi:hypothetical protein N008_20885 [Hymenobacter sp. APR13]|nr:hypothetical protein N008_20885 [Hymenobacter sp. APR13]